MFKLDPKIYKGTATTELIAKVVHEIGHMFDVLSPKILENRTRIIALEQKIKELERKWNIGQKKKSIVLNTDSL